MGERFPGGVISKTPPTVTPPTGGEGGSASGLWSLTEVLDYEKAGAWPKPILPKELYAWGDNSPNGQLGDGTIIDRSSPVQIGALTDWTYVSAGGYHSASIKGDGTLWTWGDNAPWGQLGDNTVVNKSSPVQIGALTNWSQVSAGEYHTASVKTDGTMWIWGRNTFGQVGDGTVVARSSPVQIGALTNWSQLSAGTYHTLAVKSDGSLWAWGLNNSGQLGQNNTVIARSSPVQVGALTNWSQASAGSYSAAVKTDGTLWAWGGNTAGGLGDGTTINRSSPVQIGALTNWSQVSTDQSTSAVKTDGTLWGWGSNVAGGVGDGTIVYRSSPVQIGALTTWDFVSTGGRVGKSFTLAVKTDGTLWAWGYNLRGSPLGLNDTAYRSSPVQVGAETNWFLVATGNVHTVANTKG